MNLKKICALALMLIGANAESRFEFGGHDGNGGGGFCHQGVCKTAAEAGIKIRGTLDKSDYWIVPMDVIKELEDITSSLPMGGEEILKKSFGQPRTYMVVDGLDKRALKKIKTDYIRVMRKNNFSPPKGELEIFAVSSSKGEYNEQTYLLPEFFNLSARQKALILIHEGNIRQGLSLERTLEFDSLLLQYLESPEKDSFDYLRFLGALNAQVLDRDSSKLSALVVDYIQRKSNKRLTLANFRDKDFLSSFPVPSYWMMGDLSAIAPMAIAKSSATFGVRFSSIFAHASMLTAARRSGEPWLVHSDDARKACLGKETHPRFEKWALVSVYESSYSGLYAINCSTESRHRTFEGYQVIFYNMNLGNQTE